MAYDASRYLLHGPFPAELCALRIIVALASEVAERLWSFACEIT
jgi:hypothetical protein